MNPSTAILYHGGCIDGFTAAWAVARSPGVAGEPVTLIPVRHTEPPPELTGAEKVYVVDFCYPLGTLTSLASKGRVVSVFDHHQSAMDQIGRHIPELLVPDATHLSYNTPVDEHGYLSIQIDMKRSGAGIAWDFMHGTERPPLVDYVEDRDLWRHDLPDSREVSAYLRTLEPSLELWGELAATDINQLADQGRGVVAQLDAIVRDAVDRSYMCEMGDRTFPITNVVYTAGSDTAEALCAHWGTPMAGYFLQLETGGWQYGFRSADADVMTVHDFAEQFGGGGHPAASGCRSHELLHRRAV